MSDDPGDKIKRLMRESVPDRNTVADFVAAARKRGRPIAPAPTVLKISGNHSAGVVGNNNQVNITVNAPTRRVRVEVRRGPGDITEAQAAEIQELVAKIVDVSGKPFSLVWSSVKRKFRVSSYRLIPAEQFAVVRKYLRGWVASEIGLDDPEPPAARQRALARIHAEAKKVPGLLDRVKAYAHGRFDSQSLGALSVEQLHEIIRQFDF